MTTNFCGTWGTETAWYGVDAEVVDAVDAAVEEMISHA